MPSLSAEITGRYDHAADAGGFLYAPPPRPLTVRQSRRYLIDYEGDTAALTAFLGKVLADAVSHDLKTGDTPAWQGSSFILDYGMKGGALDLEKETILAHHHGDPGAGFTIKSLRIQRRLYVFDDSQAGAGAGDVEALSARFVRDIVNPAIHTWQVS